MEGKGQTIFLSIIGIATLLVAIIGATFAWFSISVQGNEDAKPIIMNTATLGTVSFEDGSEISLTNIFPTLVPTTKTFKVENTTEGATETLKYNIYLDVTNNTLTPYAEGYFTHSLNGVSSNNGTVAMPVIDTEVPTTRTLIGSGVLNGVDSHTYTYSIIFKESNTNQNAAQGKTFSGRIQVELVNE